MALDDLQNTGRDIMNDIQHSIETGNFSGLDQRISSRVKTAANTYRRTQANPRQQGWSQQMGRPVAPPNQPPQNYFLVKKVNRSDGLLQTLVGSLMTFVNGIAALGNIHLILSSNPLTGVVTVGVLAALTAVGGFLWKIGAKKRKLAKTYYTYGARLAGHEYVDVADFAAAIGVPVAEVRKNFQDMITAGYLPQAVFDKQQTNLILTQRAYRLYQEAEQNSAAAREEQERIEQEKFEKAQAERKSLDEMDGASAEIRGILKTGTDYIRRVRQYNDEIPDTEEMSQKLYRLENVIHKIFEQVKKQPESAQDLRKFMNYYLPMTEKLMKAYVELKDQPEVGDNIVRTKKEIVAAMDTVNDAYEQLLNDLFQDTAWDISSDINVMKTMLEQDGLVKDKEKVPAGVKPKADDPMKLKEMADDFAK